MAVLTTRYWDPVKRSNDQKLSWPASHKSCQAAWGEEFKARKQESLNGKASIHGWSPIDPTSAWGWVNGRSSMNRRLAIERFLLLTFCTRKCQMATVLCTYKQSGSLSTKSRGIPKMLKKINRCPLDQKVWTHTTSNASCWSGFILSDPVDTCWFSSAFLGFLLIL
jgi:hypothetical protein